MEDFRLSANGIGKYFIRNKFIFRNVNFDINNGSTLAITGRNGSGKSTLLRIISGIFSPSEGKLDLSVKDSNKKAVDIKHYLGFVSPYLVLYEEFTVLEFLELMSRIKGNSFNKDKALDLIDDFGLFPRKKDEIRTFSSGMKQRVKYLYALLNDPLILMLDEPFTNLDIPGIEKVEEHVDRHLKNNGAVIIATNDEREKAICNMEVNLSDHKT